MTLAPQHSTKEQAARFLNCSQRQIDRYREQGVLRPPLHPGIRQKVRIPDEDLVALNQKLQQVRCAGAVPNISRVPDFVKTKTAGSPESYGKKSASNISCQSASTPTAS